MQWRPVPLPTTSCRAARCKLWARVACLVLLALLGSRTGVSTASFPSGSAISIGTQTRRNLLTLPVFSGFASVSLPNPAVADTDSGEGRFAGFKKIRPIQYIAALGDPNANSGTEAQKWGLWRLDPGPRGVNLNFYNLLKLSGGKALRGWQFDENDWWLEEHGLIMEKPDTPMPPGRYVVTGAREVKSVLTVSPPGENGNSAWSLADGAKLYDVTHLPCRSARYRPTNGVASTCTPAAAKTSDFPVTPGAPMPPVDGCSKIDYAVLFVIGVEK